VIIEQVDRLDHTVTSLLKFARPPEPQLRPTLLPDVIERVLTLEAERLAEGKVAIERRYAARVPTLYLDPGLIEQVLLNLVQNAVQAMPGGGRVMTVVASTSGR
jgi:nitrogen-specific signal transduction histidine kinase